MRGKKIRSQKLNRSMGYKKKSRKAAKPRRKNELYSFIYIMFIFSTSYFLCTFIGGGLEHQRRGSQPQQKQILTTPVFHALLPSDIETVREQDLDHTKPVTRAVEENDTKEIPKQKELTAPAVPKDRKTVAAVQPGKKNENNLVAYLTFDDGPSENTVKILDILKEFHIKATFFVVGAMAEKNEAAILRESKEGHYIGNHTYSHNYQYLYTSPENFLQDIHKNEDVLKKILGGYNANIVRFPGGSFGRPQACKDDLTKSGYKYFDWNCLNGDAETVYPVKEKLVQRFEFTAGEQKKLIILMHDASTKEATVEALPEIIKYLINKGYIFKTLNEYS